MSTATNFLDWRLMLLFIQPLSGNSVINCRALYPLHSFRFFFSKLCLLYWIAAELREHDCCVDWSARVTDRHADGRATVLCMLLHANNILYFTCTVRIRIVRMLSIITTVNSHSQLIIFGRMMKSFIVRMTEIPVIIVVDTRRTADFPETKTILIRRCVDFRFSAMSLSGKDLNT